MRAILMSYLHHFFSLKYKEMATSLSWQTQTQWEKPIRPSVRVQTKKNQTEWCSELNHGTTKWKVRPLAKLCISTLLLWGVQRKLCRPQSTHKERKKSFLLLILISNDASTARLSHVNNVLIFYLLLSNIMDTFHTLCCTYQHTLTVAVTCLPERNMKY